jgi:hypothetical protein
VYFLASELKYGMSLAPITALRLRFSSTITITCWADALLCASPLAEAPGAGKSNAGASRTPMGRPIGRRRMRPTTIRGVDDGRAAAGGRQPARAPGVIGALTPRGQSVAHVAAPRCTGAHGRQGARAPRAPPSHPIDRLRLPAVPRPAGPAVLEHRRNEPLGVRLGSVRDRLDVCVDSRIARMARHSLQRYTPRRRIWKRPAARRRTSTSAAAARAAGSTQRHDRLRRGRVTREAAGDDRCAHSQHVCAREQRASLPR